MPTRRALILALPAFVAGCASLSMRDPISVHVAGLESMPGEGMEARFLLKLRVLNPNSDPVPYDGVYVALDLGGTNLATGVSDREGILPRYGEALFEIPVSVSVIGVLRQAFALTGGDGRRIPYALRGKLAGAGFGGVRFEARGEVELGAASASAR